MPPELLTTGRLSKAADTYSFGVLLWEMYTGQRPWAGMLQMQIIFNVTVQKKQLEFPADAPEKIKVQPVGHCAQAHKAVFLTLSMITRSRQLRNLITPSRSRQQLLLPDKVT